MNNIEKYLDLFRNLSVKITNGERKPNKAIMLLSVMDLIRCGYITDNKIMLEDTIQEAFSLTWCKNVNNTPPSAWIPFWHLKKEPFWHFSPLHSKEDIDCLTKPGETASLSQMQSVIQYAYLDEELFALMSQGSMRDKLTEVLLEEYIRLLEH